MGIRIAILALLAFWLPSSPAAANICLERWKEGRAAHVELQNQAIEDLNKKDYKAACKTMRELADLSENMRRFFQQNCRGNEAAKRMFARADDIAARAQEICAKAAQ